MRATPHQNYRNEKGDIVESLIYNPESKVQLIKWSLNLYGHFKSIDSKYYCTNKDLYQSWDLGTEGIFPAEEEIEYREEVGNLFFHFKELRNISLDFMDSSNQKEPIKRIVTSQIMHSPTKINFWHMEVFWKSDGNTYIQDLSKSPQRAAIGALKTYLRVLADENEPNDFYLIDQILYSAS